MFITNWLSMASLTIYSSLRVKVFCFFFKFLWVKNYVPVLNSSLWLLKTLNFSSKYKINHYLRFTSCIPKVQKDSKLYQNSSFSLYKFTLKNFETLSVSYVKQYCEMFFSSYYKQGRCFQETYSIKTTS